MRLCRFTDLALTAGPRVGLLEDDHIVPLGPEPRSASHAVTSALIVEVAMSRQPLPAAGPEVALAEAVLLAPLARATSVRDFYAYEDHVATARRSRGLEMDPDWYELPVFYFSNPAAIRGPGEAVWAPAGSEELDYELEVAAVIGRSVSSPGPADWVDAVAGFCIMNDWSARDLQRREMRQGLGPAKGKDFATSLGPWLVTPDELPDVAGGRPSATMTASVNGREWSRGEMAGLQFPWGDLIAHAGRDVTLQPGDVIGSGTVGTGCILELAGVHGSDRFPWLQPGDEVSLSVDGLGTLTNPIVAHP